MLIANIGGATRAGAKLHEHGGKAGDIEFASYIGEYRDNLRRRPP